MLTAIVNIGDYNPKLHILLVLKLYHKFYLPHFSSMKKKPVWNKVALKVDHGPKRSFTEMAENSFQSKSKLNWIDKCKTCSFQSTCCQLHLFMPVGILVEREREREHSLLHLEIRTEKTTGNVVCNFLSICHELR